MNEKLRRNYETISDSDAEAEEGKENGTEWSRQSADGFQSAPFKWITFSGAFLVWLGIADLTCAIIGTTSGLYSQVATIITIT